jgi:hypothetical protein
VNGRLGRVVDGVPAGDPGGGGTVIVTGTLGFTMPTCAQAGVVTSRSITTTIGIGLMSASQQSAPL